MNNPIHESYMQEALALARKGIYSCHPNPMVGCVIVKNNEVIGRGYHKRAGCPHAEVYALQEAGVRAQGASVYVTLEPCCHFGRTPPCVDALIKAGVKEVFVASADPNPKVSGHGLAKLIAHGIKVQTGYCEQEARHLNRVFFQYIRTQSPYIIGKWAMSLDGKMIVHQEDSKILSSEESLRDLHELRAQIPGIMIGANTARADDPALTVRFTDTTGLRQPQRIVLNAKADLPDSLRLFNGSLPGKTWLFCAKEYVSFARSKFSSASTEVFACTLSDGKIDLKALLKQIGTAEISAVLVEGGPSLLQGFLRQNLINETVTYLTPWLIADWPQKKLLSNLEMRQTGQDLKITGLLT